MKTAQHLLQSSIAPSTVTNYQRTWTGFSQFVCHILKQSCSLPVSVAQVILYVANLAEQGARPTTVATQLSALSFIHKLRGLPDPTATFIVSKMVQGLRHTSKPPTARLPITLQILQRITSALTITITSHYQRTMFRAMFLLAFYACLRIGEIARNKISTHLLQLSDVRFGHALGISNTNAIVNLSSFKHSSPNSIQSIKIRDSPPMYPVRSLINYIKLRGTQHGPLFIWQDGTPVTYNQFTNVLKSCLAAAGLPAQQYKSHSFRIGRATLALQEGYTELQIMKLGRWKSTAHLRYLVPATLPS